MSLADRVVEELKAAMRAKDKVRLATVRALRGEIIKQQKSGAGVEVADEDVVRLVKSQIKQRQDAAASFRQGNREEQARNEETEIEVLKTFLPEELSAAELARLVDEAIAETGATSVKEMGQVMKTVMPKIRASGKDADNRQLAGLVKQQLGQNG